MTTIGICLVSFFCLSLFYLFTTPPGFCQVLRFFSSIISDNVKELYLLSITDFFLQHFYVIYFFYLLSILINIFSCSYFRKFQGTDVQINISRFYVFFIELVLELMLVRLLLTESSRGLQTVSRSATRSDKLYYFFRRKIKNGEVSKMYINNAAPKMTEVLNFKLNGMNPSQLQQNKVVSSQ